MNTESNNEPAIKTQENGISKAVDKTALDEVVKKQTEDVMTIIRESDGGPSLDIELNKLGDESLKKVFDIKKTMATKIDEQLQDLEKGSPLASILNDTTEEMIKLNPNTMKSGFFFKYLPIKSIQRKTISSYVSNFMKESRKVQLLFDTLQEGKELMITQAVELDFQYKALRETHLLLQESISVFESVQNRLEQIDPNAMNENDQRKLSLSKSRIAIKIRDFETVITAINQFYLSINQTAEVNNQLSDSINSVMLVGPIVLQNAININASISKQKSVIEATSKVSDVIGKALVENSNLVKENAVNSAEIYSNPVIALESFEEAYENFVEAIRTTDTARKEATNNANSMVTNLRSMNKNFEVVISNFIGERNSNQSEEG